MRSRSHELVWSQLYVGQTVWMKTPLGDRDIERNRSVTVPTGTPATIDSFLKENGYTYAVLNIPTSPGQKQLRSEKMDFDGLWDIFPPKTPAKLPFSAWALVLEPEV